MAVREPVPREELLKIGASLEDYHACAYKFWEMSGVYFDDSMPTACVRFSPENPPDLALNPTFWAGLTHREKLFVICHECLHVLLNHNERNGKHIDGATPKLTNVAQDITINEMIVSLFKFDRDDIRNWRKYCWIETCFDDPHIIKRNETFTYYLKLLIQQKKDELPELLDQHGEAQSGDGQSSPANSAPQPGGGTPNEPDPATEETKQKIAESLAEELSPEELEDIINAMPEESKAGNMAAMFEATLEKKVKAKKLNFAKVIAKLKRSRIKMTTTDAETFKVEDRRFDDVIRKAGAILPGKAEVKRPKKDRLLTALFMDVSGSCVDYITEFNKIAAAFIEEEDIFETRLHIFDTSVTEVKMGQRVRVGGGTHFHIIEERCLTLEKEIGKYPDCVIIVTDGEGTTVSPKAPTRWIWLLTPHPSYQYIPTRSKKHLISNVII